MCRDERLRVLKQRIAEASRKLYGESDDPVPVLIEELQFTCPHLEKVIDEEHGTATCSCCWKVFEYRRA